jgi:serpin B
LAGDNTAFAVDFYLALVDGGGNTSNQVSSPFSLSEALAMASAGAAGDTAVQLGKVMHTAQGPSDLHSAFASLDCEVVSDGDADDNQLSVANSLWGQKGKPFSSPFLGVLKDDYGAPLQQEDFATNPSGATGDINNWVSNKTSGKINNLFGPGDISSDTQLVLVNAIYFHGHWGNKFDESATQPGPFTRLDGSTVNPPMMNQKASFKLAELDDVSVLEMPYQGGKLAFDVVLPKVNNGLPAVEASLTSAQLSNWLGALGGDTLVQVTFPKFEIRSRFALNQTLSNLGMPDAFQSNADFSGMDGQQDLYLASVLQQAWIQVDEDGAEAAAATGESISAKAVVEATSFVADHPFLFFLRDISSGSVLFMGRVLDPSVAGS